MPANTTKAEIAAPFLLQSFPIDGPGRPTMKRMNVALVLMVALLLAGCEPGKQDPVLSSTEKWYEVTDVKRPKHFRARFRDDAGNQTSLLNISKHCNVWQRLHIGSRWLLTEVVRQGKDGAYTELQGVKALCSKLHAM